ncbi:MULTISPECIES: restriction endonuclease subunit S [Enterobacteriaceae]|uniref:restriction endonuclease subunit S n=1 Tax=Enterobacteriaceae TaxID=543 RepID=UPI000F51142F|nr:MULTISPECIES: restriction endonuclease subunit S [Enterobacteriaceae]ELV2218230.1 restriction endonuclease subunit S [Escherichia coli]ROW35957.1 restriction endonuclease subunit S [Citrobacter europaeus]
MNKQKKGLVPELRFPEFEKEPNWSCVKLNAVAKRSTSKNKGEKITRVLTNSAIDGIVDQRDYFDKDIAVKGNLESYYVVDEGDYVYNPRISSAAPVGPISKNKVGKGVMSPLYTIFRFNSKKNDFFEQFFKSSRWHGYLQTASNSGARHDRISITNSEFMAMPVLNPGDKEQQKIADFLASIDDLITLHAQKLDACISHRKGLMQQLFPVDDEFLPKQRFPEFRGDGKWKPRVLGNFVRERSQLPVEKVPLYSLTIEDGVSPKTERYERSFLVKNESEAYKLVKPFDFAYNPMNLRFGAIAMHSGSGDVAVSKYYNIFHCDDTVDAKFCEMYFKSAGMITHYNNVATGSLLEKRRVHFSDFLRIEIPFPSLGEQRKIAQVIGELTAMVDKQSQKVDFLKEHKKGLMQKLFPAMDEADL